MLRAAKTVATRGFSSATSHVQPRGALKDESILEHLVCPVSKYPLRYDRSRGALICDEVNVLYPIRDGLPCLIPMEGRILSDEDQEE